MQDSPNKGGNLTTIEELQNVRELIQLYIEGSDGDVTKLQRAFHPDARMVGRIGGEDGNSPIGAFIAWVPRLLFRGELSAKTKNITWALSAFKFARIMRPALE